MAEKDLLQPVNIVKHGSRFSVVFAGGSQRFIKKTELESWKAKVDAYWAANPKQARADNNPDARTNSKTDNNKRVEGEGTEPADAKPKSAPNIDAVNEATPDAVEGQAASRTCHDDETTSASNEDGVTAKTASSTTTGCGPSTTKTCVTVCVTCSAAECSCKSTDGASAKEERAPNEDEGDRRQAGEQAFQETDQAPDQSPDDAQDSRKNALESSEGEQQPEEEMAGAQGRLTTTEGATSTSVRLKGRVELDYSAKDLGWILRGFVERARGCGPDPHAMFMEDEACNDDRTPHQEKLMEMGRELFDALPAATSFFDVDSNEWHGWFRRSGVERCEVPMRSAHSATPQSSTQSSSNSMAKGNYGTSSPDGVKWVDDPNPVGPPTSLAGPREGAKLQQPTGAWTTSGAWMAPVNGPITSRFGQQRGNGDVHEGIDIGVPVGTQLVAPQTMQVAKVGYSERAGRYVVANVMRPDGTFDDGDGYRLTFAHLSEVHVEEDAVVRRGQSFGRSGATGKVTGPHLHFRAQWVEDGVLSDDVISIDPLAVIPELVFAGQVGPVEMAARQAVGIRKGQPINIVIAPGAGRVSAGGKGVMQPDVGIQLPLLGEEVSFRGQPGGIDRLEANERVIDPLEGIVSAVFEEAPGVIRGVGNFAQGVGQLASIGGTLASFIPGAAPVALPVASVGGAIGAAAQPVAQVSAGAVEFGGRLLADASPLDDII